MKKFIYKQAAVSAVCLVAFLVMRLIGIDLEIVLPVTALAVVAAFFRPPDTSAPTNAIIFTALAAAFTSALVAHLAAVVVVAILILIVVSCDPKLFLRSPIEAGGLFLQFAVLYWVLTGSIVGFATDRALGPATGATVVSIAFSYSVLIKNSLLRRN